MGQWAAGFIVMWLSDCGRFQKYIVYFIPVENTTTVFGTPRKDGFGDTVLSFMGAIYFLAVNILLISLLIAIFK